MERPVEVSDATFETEVLNARLPVLIDFWASWCAPCRAIAPVVDELAQEYAGRLKVVKVDVDANPRTVVSYKVHGIPTLLLIWEGEVLDTMVGALSKAVLKQRIEKALASDREATEVQT